MKNFLMLILGLSLIILSGCDEGRRFVGYPDTGQGDGGSDAQVRCSEDNDCLAGQVCLAGKCLTEAEMSCNDDSDCFNGYHCDPETQCCVEDFEEDDSADTGVSKDGLDQEDTGQADTGRAQDGGSSQDVETIDVAEVLDVTSNDDVVLVDVSVESDVPVEETGPDEVGESDSEISTGCHGQDYCISGDQICLIQTRFQDGYQEADAYFSGNGTPPFVLDADFRVSVNEDGYFCISPVDWGVATHSFQLVSSLNRDLEEADSMALNSWVYWQTESVCTENPDICVDLGSGLKYLQIEVLPDGSLRF